MTTRLGCEGIRFRRGDRDVLDGIDVTVDAGEVVALIGPNGAGKSTLLHIVAGILSADSGSVTRHGRVAAGLQTPALARRSAAANVELALSWWGVRSRSERRERARRALASINAEALASRSARTLSGGEARRVHLARVLAVEPDILLLDEPFAGLDPSTRADLLYDAASVLRSEQRATVVVVHDRAEAWALADRVLVLIDGRVEALGTPAEVFNDPPNATVAAFVGFAGCLESDAEVSLYRPVDVILDDQGPVAGVVERRVPVEDGVRVEIAVPRGRLVALTPQPGPELGATVRLRLVGGVTFPSSVNLPSSASPDRDPAATEPSSSTPNAPTSVTAT